MMFRNILAKSIIVILSAIFSLNTQAQTSPVNWTVAYSDSDSAITFNAQMDDHWHIYATELPSDEGPLPTEFIFEELDRVQLKGNLVEPQPIEKYDPNFELDVRYFENSVTFKQALTLDKKSCLSKQKVSGKITYMACNDEGCLPPVDHPFEITITQDKP